MGQETFVKLTRPDGKPVWLKPDEIIRITPTTPGDEEGATHLTLANGEQSVDEEPDIVVTMIERARSTA